MIDRIATVSEKLAEARRTGKKVAPLSDDLRPQSEAEAAAIREAVMRLRGSRHGGWKVSLSHAGELIASPILKDSIFTSPARIEWRQNASLGLETELAFRFKRAFPDIGEVVTVQSTLEAIDVVMPAFELLDSRYEKGFGSPRLDLLADHLGNFGIVLGNHIPDWRTRNLGALTLSLALLAPAAETIKGAHPLGDPMAPLLALAKHLANEGSAIASGDLVITGSWTGVRHLTIGSSAMVTVEAQTALQLTIG